VAARFFKTLVTPSVMNNEYESAKNPAPAINVRNQTLLRRGTIKAGGPIYDKMIFIDRKGKNNILL